MSRLQQTRSILSHIVPNLPLMLGRGFRTMWARTGDFSEALHIAKNRLLALFFETTDFCNARCTLHLAEFPFKLYHPFQIGCLHASILRFRAVVRCIADLMLSTYVFDRDPIVCFLQDCHDLRLGESRLPH